MAVLKLKIRKGDLVKVLSGKDCGKQGKILRILKKKNRVVVEGANLLKKCQRPSQENQEGGIIEREGPIHISNVQVVCPKCQSPSRMSIQILDNKSRARRCASCGETLDDGATK